jgi:hypothetical protein
MQNIYKRESGEILSILRKNNNEKKSTNSPNKLEILKSLKIKDREKDRDTDKDNENNININIFLQKNNEKENYSIGKKSISDEEYIISKKEYKDYLETESNFYNSKINSYKIIKKISTNTLINNYNNNNHKINEELNDILKFESISNNNLTELLNISQRKIKTLNNFSSKIEDKPSILIQSRKYNSPKFLGKLSNNNKKVIMKLIYF